MKKLSLHPACKLFPQLPKDELRALAADIKANGLQNSIVLYEGKILDGRNRWLACRIAKIKPTFVQWKGQGSPVAWVISENLVRRHLTSSQRAVIALDILPMLEEEAKERLTLGKKLTRVSANGKGKASQIAARLTKSNSAYVAALKAISKTAPELIEKVRNGDLSVPDAKRLSDIPKDQRKELLRQVNGQSHNGEIFRQTKDYWDQRKGNADNPRDFHPTPEHLIESLIARERFQGMIHEPAVGDGAIMRVLRKAGYNVTGTDIARGIDFLKTKKSVANIVTNPPYADGMAEKFCRHALKLAKKKVAMLLPMWFLEGVQRHELFTKEPLKAIYICSRRSTFGTDQASHAPFGTMWAVWEIGYKGKARIEWILD